MKKFFKEFKTFISKGNVIDLAVGLIIATAFNKIVSSLVNDLIMPLITYSTGKSSLSALSIVLRRDASGAPTLTWAYGNFIQTVIDFLIIAFSVFMMVKVINASRERLKDLNEFLEMQTKKEIREQKKIIKAQAKAEKKKFKILWKEHLAEQERIKQEKAKLAMEEKLRLEAEEKLKNPSEKELLTEIRDLLKAQNSKKSK